LRQFRTLPFRSSSTGRTGIVGNFFISYVLVLLVPFFFGFFIYQQSISIITESIRNANLNRLKQASDIFENNLEKAKIALAQISLDQKTLNLVHSQNLNINSMIWEIKLAMNLISSIKTSENVNDCFILFYEWNVVVISGGMYNINSFYNNFIAASGESFNDWIRDQYSKEPRMGFYRSSEISLPETSAKKRVFEYTVSIPYTPANRVLGSVHVLIDENVLKEIMTPSANEEFSYITDGKGNIISFFSNKYAELPKYHKPLKSDLQKGYFTESTEMGKEEVYFTHSPDGNWIFVTVQSQNSIVGKVTETKNTFIFFMAISVVIALVISFFLSWGKSRPMIKLLGENRAIRNEIDRQRPVLENVFLSRLLRGEINDEDEIRINFQRMNIDTTGKNFVVILAYPEKMENVNNEHSFPEVSATKAILRENVQSNSEGIIFLTVDMDENSTVFICIAPYVNPSEYIQRCRIFFTQIRDKIRSEYFFSVNFTLGEPTELFSRLYYSFETAKLTQENNILRGTTMGINVFDGSIKKRNHYDYSILTETRLINFVREGNIDGVNTILNHIFDAPKTSNPMDTESVKLFLTAIKNTLLRLNTMIFSGIPELYSDFDKRIMGIEVFDKKTIVDIFDSICRSKLKQKTSSNVELKESILKYIHDNYRRNDFYLGSLTYHYKLSETYLSLFFKECTGENFIAYVEKLRLDDACELLKDLSPSIETIASTVGYSSSHAFRRAFKRRFGISPTEYRNRVFSANKTDKIRPS